MYGNALWQWQEQQYAAAILLSQVAVQTGARNAFIALLVRHHGPVDDAFVESEVPDFSYMKVGTRRLWDGPDWGECDYRAHGRVAELPRARRAAQSNRPRPRLGRRERRPRCPRLMVRSGRVHRQARLDDAEGRRQRRSSHRRRDPQQRSRLLSRWRRVANTLLINSRSHSLLAMALERRVLGLLPLGRHRRGRSRQRVVQRQRAEGVRQGDRDARRVACPALHKRSGHGQLFQYSESGGGRRDPARRHRNCLLNRNSERTVGVAMGWRCMRSSCSVSLGRGACAKEVADDTASQPTCVSRPSGVVAGCSHARSIDQPF